MRGINWTIIVIDCHPYLLILIIFIHLILHIFYENHVYYFVDLMCCIWPGAERNAELEI